MSPLPEPQDVKKKEHPSTYMVQDRSNKEELARLRLQDKMLTADMGGVLSEQPDPSIFQQVIDVGCGTGGWLLACAHLFPHMRLLAGIDVSRSMIDAAKVQAMEAGVNDRVEFRVMDALRMIEYQQKTFDVVNQRVCFSYLRKWDWPNILQEYQRIAKIGGIVRITEPNIFSESNSEVFNQLADLVINAFWHAGHLFTPARTGVIDALPGLFHQQGLTNVQTRLITMEYTANRPGFPTFVENTRLILRTMRPFLHKWTKLPDNYEQLMQQAVVDMADPGFEASFQLLTVWGENTQINDKLSMLRDSY